MATVEIASKDEIREIIKNAFAEKTNASKKYSIESILSAGQCWKIIENNVMTAAMITKNDNGELWVLAAAGKSTSDLTEIMAKHLIGNSEGYRSIGFQTERKGLVKKAQMHGYRIAGYIMRKEL